MHYSIILNTVSHLEVYACERILYNKLEAKIFPHDFPEEQNV